MARQTICEVLKEYREAERLSIRKAAALADMDATVLSRIENGHRLPTSAQLVVLAEIYGKQLEPLLAVNAYSEIKQKYGQTEYFEDCLQMLNEDSGTYGKR